MSSDDTKLLQTTKIVKSGVVGCQKSLDLRLVSESRNSHNSSGQRARLPEGTVSHVSVDDQTVTTRVVSDTERLVNTSGVFDVTTKGAALRGRGEEGALDGDQASGGSLTHDVVEHRDSLEDAGIVRGLTAQISVESREVDDGGRLNGDTVTVGTAIASRTASLFVKVDVVADLVPLLERPGENIAIKDPALTSGLLGGLAVPNGLDQATLLSTSADLDLVLVDGLGRQTSDGEGVETNFNLPTELGGRLTTVELVTSAASVGPHGGAEIDVLDIVGDAGNHLSGRTSGSGVTVAVEALKGKVSSRLSGGRGTAGLTLTLGVALG